MRTGDKYKLVIEQELTSRYGKDSVILEHRFHPVRRWRFDFAVPRLKLAMEYQGHGHTGGGHIGRHATITGISGDAEKFNQAQVLGWKVICLTALFFSERSRKKHKLTPVSELLDQFDQARGARAKEMVKARKKAGN